MKKIIALLLLLVAVLSLSGCGKNALADCFDESEVNTKAEEICMLLANRDYDTIYTMFREDIRSDLTPEYLEEQLDDIFEASGDFVKFRGTACAGQTTEEGEDYAIAMIIAKFENGKITFTISFDQNMELIGLYVK